MIQDLKPYICLVERCRNPQVTLDNFEEWVEHMKEDQKDSGSDVLTSCPLCLYQLGLYQRFKSDVDKYEHIAGHLRSLVLNSLSLISSSIQPESEINISSKDATQVQRTPLSPMNIFQLLVNPPRTLEVSPIVRGFGERNAPVLGNHGYGLVPRPFPETSRTKVSASQSRNEVQDPAIDTEMFDILLAEDNRINQRLMLNLLGRFQHVVVVANNGQEAVDAFKQRKYDLILMDVLMPIMVSKSASLTAQKAHKEIGWNRSFKKDPGT